MRTNLASPFVRITNVSEAHECRIAWSVSTEATVKRRGRPPAPVDPNTSGGRLRALREAAGLSQDDLAAALQVDRSMISKYEDGRHDMGPEILKRAASRFEVTASFILFGEKVDYAHRSAPVVGRVGAGAEVEAIQDANPELIEVPADFADAQAFKVEGESCLPIFEPGDILVVRGSASASEGEFLNRFCVVETDEGLGYVKSVVRGMTVPGQGQLYTLESPNADNIPNVRLKRVRPISMRILRGSR